MKQTAVTIIGMEEAGCLGLSARAFHAVSKASILLGHSRYLDFFPDFPGEKMPLEGPLKKQLENLVEKTGEANLAILASGDPLFFGIGSLALHLFGHQHVRVIPTPSSIQWAFAAAKISWSDARLLSVHGRSMQGLVTRLRDCKKAALLCDPDNSPNRIAQHLLAYHDSAWQAVVCEDLGGTQERVRHVSLDRLAETDDLHELCVLILLRPDDWIIPTALPYAAEECFAKRMPKFGLITKREIRLLSLAALQIKKESIVWDIGAGSGAVGIEAAYLATEGRVYAIECDPEGQSICEQNVQSLGADNVQVIKGMAPDVCTGLEDPDAVFIGGSKGQLQNIIALAYQRLRPGGRLVVNAVTLENVSCSIQAFEQMNIAYDLQLVQVSRSVPLAGRYHRYEALNPIHIFACSKGDA